MLDQEELADRAKIHRDRLRAILARSNPKQATIEELWALATATGAPRSFSEHGFAGQIAAKEEVKQEVLDLKTDVGRLDAMVRHMSQTLADIIEDAAVDGPPESAFRRRLESASPNDSEETRQDRPKRSTRRRTAP